MKYGCLLQTPGQDRGSPGLRGAAWPRQCPLCSPMDAAKYPFLKGLLAAHVSKWARGTWGHQVSMFLSWTRKGHVPASLVYGQGQGQGQGRGSLRVMYQPPCGCLTFHLHVSLRRAVFRARPEMGGAVSWLWLGSDLLFWEMLACLTTSLGSVFPSVRLRGLSSTPSREFQRKSSRSPAGPSFCVFCEKQTKQPVPSLESARCRLCDEF